MKKKPVIYAISVFLFVFLWELLALCINQSLVLPSPLQVLVRLCQLLKTRLFWISLGTSFLRVILAFLIVGGLGLILGFLAGFYDNFRTFISFPLSVVRSTPVVALVMIMLFWFKSTMLPVFCAVLMGLPVLTDVVSKAVSTTDKKLLEMSRIFAFTPVSRLCGIYIPSALPHIEGALKTVFSMSWKVVAAGEILSLPRHALGTLLQDNRILMESESVFALVLVITVFGILSEKLLFALPKFWGFLSSFLGVSPSRLRRLGAGPSAAAPSGSEPSVFGPLSAPQTAPAPDASISVSNLTFSYENKCVFQDLSMQTESGSITAITGKNGCGKTTLLNILSGLIPSQNYSGKVSCPKVSFIFQEPRLIPNVSVVKNLALPLYGKTTRKEALALAIRALESAGLFHLAFQKAESLSGGEKQKIQALRAFMSDAPVILMDEATTALDEKSTLDFWSFICAMQENNPRTLLFVTHNLQEAERYAQKVVTLP